MANAAPGLQHLVQCAIDARAFLFFALNECDALPVLAQPGEHIAQFGLGLVLVLGNGNEAAADQQHRTARDHGIKHRCDHQKAGNIDVHAADAEAQCAADGPQYDNEGCSRKKGLRHPADEIDRRLGRDTDVVGDTVFRVLVISADEIELVVAAGFEPAEDQTVGEPFAPSALDGHPGVNLCDAEADAHRKDREIQQRKMKDSAGVFFLQRIEDAAIPEVHRIGGGEVEQDDHQQRGAQQPGGAIARCRPEAERRVPEAPQQIASPKVLGILVVVVVAAPGVALGRFRRLGLGWQIGFGLGFRLGLIGIGSGGICSGLVGPGGGGFHGVGIFFVRTPLRTNVGHRRTSARRRRLNRVDFSTCPINAWEPDGFH